MERVGRRYRIQEVLGAGGFGTVYRAELVAEAGSASRSRSRSSTPDGAARTGSRGCGTRPGCSPGSATGPWSGSTR